MQLQKLIAFTLEGVDTWVLPDIGAVAAILSQLEVVDVFAFPLLEDEDQLML